METPNFINIPSKLKGREFNAIGSDLKAGIRLTGVEKFAPTVSSPYYRALKKRMIFEVREAMLVAVKNGMGIVIDRSKDEIEFVRLSQHPDSSSPSSSMQNIEYEKIDLDFQIKALDLLLQVCLYLALYEAKNSNEERSKRIQNHLQIKSGLFNLFIGSSKAPILASYLDDCDLSISNFASQAEGWWALARRIHREKKRLY